MSYSLRRRTLAESEMSRQGGGDCPLGSGGAVLLLHLPPAFAAAIIPEANYVRGHHYRPSAELPPPPDTIPSARGEPQPGTASFPPATGAR